MACQKFPWFWNYHEIMLFGKRRPIYCSSFRSLIFVRSFANFSNFCQLFDLLPIFRSFSNFSIFCQFFDLLSIFRSFANFFVFLLIFRSFANFFGFCQFFDLLPVCRFLANFLSTSFIFCIQTFSNFAKTRNFIKKLTIIIVDNRPHEICISIRDKNLI